jgi:hypothetical protein
MLASRSAKLGIHLNNVLIIRGFTCRFFFGADSDIIPLEINKKVYFHGLELGISVPTVPEIKFETQPSERRTSTVIHCC